MTFHFENELNAIVNIAREHAIKVDTEAVFPQQTIDALKNSSLFGLLISEENGGLGGSFTQAATVIEALAQVCGSSSMVVCMHYVASAVVAAHAAKDVQTELTSEKRLATLAFSEQGSRSHFWAPVSNAAESDSAFVLNANKSWVTSAHEADYFVFSSQPTASKEASSLFLVRKGDEGLKAVGNFKGLGLRGNDSTPMTAENMSIPLDRRLGEDGAGFGIMMGLVLPLFSACSAACSLGLSRGVLNKATEHLSKTSYEHLGSDLRDLPTIRAYLAKAHNKETAARLVWEDTLKAIESGREDTMMRVLQVKAMAGETALETVQTCMRVCGGAAFRKDLGIERYMRDAQAASVMAPTSDVLYDFIGKILTGLELF